MEYRELASAIELSSEELVQVVGGNMANAFSHHLRNLERMQARAQKHLPGGLINRTAKEASSLYGVDVTGDMVRTAMATASDSGISLREALEDMILTP